MNTTTTFEDAIREIVRDELLKSPAESPPMPLEEFITKAKIKRVQLWRWEKQGKIKFHRIGKKIYVPASEVRRIFTHRKIEQ